MNTLSGLLPRRNFARCKIHFTSKSCVLLYWQRHYTALQQWASAKLCGMVQGMELPNFRTGHHLYSAAWPSRWASAHILHLVSKNVPPLTCYNLDIHRSIMIIFGTSVTEKVGVQNVLYFPTSLNLCFCTTWGNRKHKNCLFTEMLHAFYQKQQNALKYHLVTTEPPFTVKTIDWMHQTGPKIKIFLSGRQHYACNTANCSRTLD